MKNSPLSLLSLATAFFLATPVASLLFAQDPVVVQPAPTVSTVPTQTTTVTTINPDGSKTTQTTVTNPPATPAVVVAPAPPVVVQPGQHVAEIEVILSRGTAQAYFGRAPRGEKFAIGDASIRIKLPSTATVTKLASRDKDSEGATEITTDNPWHITVPFSEPGRYVFNIVDWDDAAAAEVFVKIDGVVKFQGHGRSDEIRNWPDTTYGEGVHRTGSREIAFDVQ